MKNLLAIFAIFALAIAAPAQDSTITTRNVYAYAGVPASGTDELNTITIGGTPTAGTFTITVAGGRTTAPITWSATNATLLARVDAALEALSVIGVGGVTTADSTLASGIGDLTVTLAGKNARQDFAAMSVTSSLTGTNPTLAIANTTPGVAATFQSAPAGTLLVDTTNRVLYQNTSATVNSPTWTAAASTLSLDTSAELRTILTDETGTGVAVFATTPTFVTPVLGVATATSINGNVFTTGSSTYTGTAAQTYTFPTTSATIARTDAANTFTGVQTMTSPVLTTPAIGAATGASLTATGGIRTSSASVPIGYNTGAGGAVTQITSRSTTVVVVPNPCTTGAITTTADSLAGLAIATFTVTDSAVALGDTVILSKVSGDVDTFAWVNAVGSGSFNVSLRNSHASDADTTAFVFNFAVIKGSGN